MIELVVFIDKSASLVRLDQISRELARTGVEVTAKVPSVGVIVVRCEDPGAATTAIRRIPDVVGVKQRASS
jgi:hypothetical protein